MNPTDPYRYRQSLGVLGGMGPLAGAAFAERLVQLTPGAGDHDHIPVILLNDPRIPDRVGARLRGTQSPAPEMTHGIHTLINAGADCIVIPCNTAHFWFDELQRASSKPILHIVEAVIDDLKRLGVPRGAVGVLGTPATIKCELYQAGLIRAGYEAVVPDDQEIETLLKPAIAAIKVNQLEPAFDLIARAIEHMKRRKTDAVVLGCTELPLAVPHARRPEFGVAITDSIDALARAAIQWMDEHGRADESTRA